MSFGGLLTPDGRIQHSLPPLPLHYINIVVKIVVMFSVYHISCIVLCENIPELLLLLSFLVRMISYDA